MFDDHGLLGAGIAAGDIYQEHRYEEYVRAFIAQGQTLPIARASALRAMGLKVPPGTPTRKTYVGRAWFWGVLSVALTVFFYTPHVDPGSLVIFVAIVAYCVYRCVKNLRHLR